MSTPALAIPDNGKTTREQVQTSDFFALCYLMLSNLAYCDEDNAHQAVQNQAVAEIRAILQNAVAKLQNDVSKLPVIGGLAVHELSFTINDQAFQNIGEWVQALLFQHSVLTGYWNAVKDSPGVAFIDNPFGQAQAAATGAKPQL